ncbi:hypothetical protein PC116_g17239 [Phytophthora cactorum]|uniref:Uncharacterized protein n=1 Tax=Phytophthora cactorum TaxID=29920 RepID=A0A8T1D3H4_9STRA|nr:hypothetical protein Pcac1_g659 [Phytophthora cactorum]KAG2932754.1 hypothetical protein PC117_g13059 [Phytophthora cactorum]KAG3030258.1 hypothetical protein PC120_g3841 [Phytophthora cactorum]KAG3198999.1 hypothetical protein PC128_g5574 [Phytophthora cactorum]KAG4234602.1 hypothetical protein PC116_g17239 [Phytophthora cactorum]
MFEETRRMLLLVRETLSAPEKFTYGIARYMP